MKCEFVFLSLLMCFLLISVVSSLHSNMRCLFTFTIRCFWSFTLILCLCFFYSEGQLGYTSVDTQPTPRRVTTLKARVVAAAVANKHSAVLTEAGEVFTWGCNREGQLGYGTSNSASNHVPHVVEHLKGKNFLVVSAAKYHTVVLSLEGEVSHSRF